MYLVISPHKAPCKGTVSVDLAIRGKYSQKGDSIQEEGTEPACTSKIFYLQIVKDTSRCLNDPIATLPPLMLPD